jgi:hypothetical protein
MRTLSIMLLLLCSGCASTGYLRDRGNDACDLVTVQLGYGLGAKARTGPLHAGASWIFTPVGLSNGELYGVAQTEEDCPADVEVLFKGVEFSPRGQARNKNYRAGWGWPFIAWPQGEDLDPNAFLWPHPYYTDFRISAGLGPAATLGVNPGEFVDFLLGWFAVDVYGDDGGENPRVSP